MLDDSNGARPAVRLLLFGSASVDHGGQSTALPFERRSQLLVLLALKRSWIGRAELAAMLWPEQAGKQAHANLRKTLFRLQSALWAPPIEAQGNAVRLDAATDVAAFDLALREHRIADALPLRRGELLAGFDDEHSEAWTHWLGFERERLRVAWRGAALERLAGSIEPAEGIELSARLLEADPLDEAALRAQMQWLAKSGQSARARHAYQAFVARLAQDLGLAPGAELQALHEGLGTITPLLGSAPNAPDDGFVGRSVEVRQAAELLAQDDCRLLCLVGPGGVGKTRLARRVIQELAPGYADGVAFVALEDAAATSELGVRLARDIGIGLSGSGEPLDQVIAFLRERHMLLVLDNFEQLAADAVLLEKLLQACLRLKIIVTTRVRLGVSMEWLVPLEGLPCPEPEDQDRFEAFDAVRLFVKAARRVAPAIHPVAEAAAIVDICRQVDGLPLALELAAAWTRVLSCEAIANELRQGTELLRAVDAHRLARQASIEVVFEQSWRLLTETECEALVRLSVFRGGFSLEAARAVAKASLPVLGALADKSLLRKDGARLLFHPLVHQLAGLRLHGGAERASTEAAHAQYFHRLLAQLRHAIEGGDRAALQQVEVEFENCRAAWRWAISNRAAELLTKSARSVLRFCDHRGRFEEGLTLLREGLESRVAAGDPTLALQLLGAAAHLEFRLDRFAVAEAAAAQALAAAKLARDPYMQSHCLNVLGSCALTLGQYRNARHFYQQAWRQALAGADPRKAAAMLDNQALVEKALGRYAQALRLSTQSLADYQRLGDVAGEALCLNNLGALQLDVGAYEPAWVYLKAGLALSERHAFVNTRGFLLTNLTELGINSGDCDAAQTYAEQALRLAQSTGRGVFVSRAKLHLALLALRRGDLTAARGNLGEALGVALGRPMLELEGVTCFADLLAAQGETLCAWRVLAFAAEHPAMAMPGRDAAAARLAQWRAELNAEPAWPGIDLGELVQRIVAETPVAHAPLIAFLRGAQ